MAKQQVTITRIFRGEQETKYGVKNKVGIKTEEHGDDKWLSTFNVKGTEGWKEGDVVEVDVTENNGFLNFKPAQDSLESRVQKLEDAVFGSKEETQETINAGDDEPNLDEF